MKINKELCIGCGACEASYPGVFNFKEGEVSIKDENTPWSKEYAETCPVEAIEE